MSGHTTSNKKAHALLYGVLFCMKNIPKDAIFSFTYDVLGFVLPMNAFPILCNVLIDYSILMPCALDKKIQVPYHKNTSQGRAVGSSLGS